MLTAFNAAHGLARFPIDVTQVAKEYSRNVFPEEPITTVEGQNFSNDFEGALVRNPISTNEWGIFYNSGLTSKGRINFTLAHELGHYLLHRQLLENEIFCAKSDMWAWNSEYGQMESQANEFASFLLMPLDDFRLQANSIKKPKVDDFAILAERYESSITATILKWLEITTKRAMLVVSKDGFIDWSWSSKPLLRSGVYFRAKQKTIELPAKSLAAQGQSIAAIEGDWLPAGIWADHEEVFETVLFSEFHNQAISLLVYPNIPPIFDQ
ncbi:ImmA/IrrE family metallo-endopeptidase [Parasphingorhabdus cellanae]|uniref:ImmA/IrrE family metallo-endopeptidase n=1 Tax=Parasphingorhabdus cellanae TaxID=2806553 RepID=A0ABX7T9X6_9SPHN|nr:ImmA/IrrE family metallo-endopeptidase [Parasphingorhabdus cellanae]QTD57195.1 ImmA/IrrE family metallo-endopeptidase [Parasphingorhabdus cellanae]